jgi:hypothetical protein
MGQRARHDLDQQSPEKDHSLPRLRVQRISDSMKDKLESQEFYELMQRYRHVNQREQEGEDNTVVAFEAVKWWIRDNFVERK